MKSDRLKKWMRKHPRLNRIYALGWSNIHGQVVCDPHDMFTQDIWIGGERDEYWISGANIRNIVGGHTKSTQVWALGIGRMKNLVDITDWFWKSYEAKGICLFTYRHDWAHINRHSRKCKGCGEHQTRTIETRTERRRVEIWA